MYGEYRPTATLAFAMAFAMPYMPPLPDLHDLNNDYSYSIYSITYKSMHCSWYGLDVEKGHISEGKVCQIPQVTQ